MCFALSYFKAARDNALGSHHIHALELLADLNALPALKTTAQLLVEANVHEPLAAIAGAIITLGGAGEVRCKGCALPAQC